MGFGATFEAQAQARPNERANYVRYAAFKEKLLAMAAKGNLRRDSAAREGFARDYQAEVDRLTRFAGSSVESIWMRIDLVHGELPADAKDPKAQKISLYRVQDIEQDIDDLGKEILSFREFMSSNVEAFQHIAQKFDQMLRESGVKAKSPLDASAFSAKRDEVERLVETFLVLLSDLYARARRTKNNKEGGDAVWVPPESFQRKTTKYWVKAEDLLAVKFQIIKHLPLLIFGRKQGGKTEEGGSLSFVSQNEETLRDSQKISSVYYDTEDLQVYHNRLLRHDFASLVRVRWYGERDDSLEFPLFVERKVHREFWTGNKSVKERCPIDQGDLSAALDLGRMPPGLTKDDKSGALLASIQSFLREGGKKQVPMVRTQYMRSAYQEATSNAVRISIDTDLKMVRERGAPRREGDWCRDMAAPLPPCDVVDFPYAVLEVKLQDEPAPWVNELTEGGMLVAVPKFSKFQNGMALLYPSKLRNSPWWFLPDGKGGMTPANFEEMADTRDPYLEKANPAFFGEAKAPALAGRNPSGAGKLEHVDCTKGSKGLERKRSVGKMVKSLFVATGDGPNEYHIMCMPLSRRSSSAKKQAAEGSDEESSDLTMTPRAKAIVRTRIEPKTFFANERTFLSWLQVRF